jgi:hypothetical protein
MRGKIRQNGLVPVVGLCEIVTGIGSALLPERISQKPAIHRQKVIRAIPDAHVRAGPIVLQNFAHPSAQD